MAFPYLRCPINYARRDGLNSSQLQAQLLCTIRRNKQSHSAFTGDRQRITNIQCMLSMHVIRVGLDLDMAWLAITAASESSGRQYCSSEEWSPFPFYVVSILLLGRNQKSANDCRRFESQRHWLVSPRRRKKATVWIVRVTPNKHHLEQYPSIFLVLKSAELVDWCRFLFFVECPIVLFRSSTNRAWCVCACASLGHTSHL